MNRSSGGDKTVSSGTITYRGPTMEGMFKMKITGKANMQMTTKLSGKRIIDFK
jgi:hypothetical protein